MSEAMTIIGNGDYEAGALLVAALAERMAYARGKHPVFAEGMYQALGVVGLEYAELVKAVERESEERVRDETLDVMTTAARMWRTEYNREGDEYETKSRR